LANECDRKNILHMEEVETILRLLDDGEWHYVDALESCVGWRTPNVKTILGFLSDQGFIQYNRLRNMVRLDPELLSLRRET
jgi:hypothetical protein